MNIYRVLGMLCIAIAAVTACAVSIEPNHDWTDGAVIMLVFCLGAVTFDLARKADTKL